MQHECKITVWKQKFSVTTKKNILLIHMLIPVHALRQEIISLVNT